LISITHKINAYQKEIKKSMPTNYSNTGDKQYLNPIEENNVIHSSGGEGTIIIVGSFSNIPL